ncbi:TPA: hypothetical protein DIV55_03090 [Patescibacteria group bacterium]|uniref:Nucleotidyl transferase AbiEii toxin, Type IV TA system n=1 Tax=Candidatus Gottesmanbacteria bacterium GW2011_GWA1_43_11 TaxID=1618436 RepID=A0A0G1EIG1_9BACT|nr:MAG: hypothetical protein UV59_C0053G0013 [Candidatus Gottesmanbacteria bacterium GW2011_GWA1_43_11]HCS78705.1 hypothetical protein [Patescibacteria group bacterium]
MFANVLSQSAQTALAVLGKSGVIADGYLAGESAFALHFGHRISEDFDFFSSKEFEPAMLSNKLSEAGEFVEEKAIGITLLGTFNTVKFSYFEYNYPLVASTTTFSNVSIAHPHDIAAMKLVAITDRGTKRDYIDLFEITRQNISFDTMFSLYDQKYKKLQTKIFTLIKALTYFDEADKTDMPQMLTPVSWGKVKQFFVSESMRLARKYLE